MCIPGNVEWTLPPAYKKVMSLNFHAPITLIQALTPLLRQSKGRIVNVTSVCGIVSAPGNSTYSASKFALEAACDALRVENRPFGVDVVAIEPGTMRTPLAMAWAHQWFDNYKSADPEHKSMHPEAWANAMFEYSNEQLEQAADDPLTMVKAMVDALVMPSPPPRIRPGGGARMYYIISLLPDRLHDALFAGFVPPPQTFAEPEMKPTKL
jgi:NAD(P)-dependent dehydrogenase (short-subunit alcohol dehydrogenase family)